MERITLYVTQSLDGFIAKKNYNINWLDEINDKKLKNNCNNYYRKMDAILTDNNTYKKLYGHKNLINFNKNIYVLNEEKTINQSSRHLKTVKNLKKGQKIYRIKNKNFTEFIDSNLNYLIEQIKKRKHKNIWLLAKSNILKTIVKNKLVDEMKLVIVPVNLGEGEYLFNKNSEKMCFKIQKTTILEGGVELSYALK
ncbi:dihydrofolate reductase family protein [Peptostreptococcaceae bacterium AGR-M142]